MRKNKEIMQDCETCANHGTMDCPTSALCYSKQNHPYWMNKPMKENRVKIAISGIPLDRLEAICTAEKDGRLVTLPCKVGDTVYLTMHGYVEETKVRTLFFGHPSYSGGAPDQNYYRIRCENLDLRWDAIGKTVFLTRSEAEKALGKEQA